ncbi:MAG: 16S rRNA (uracil(1498)-N(3))-methyltransferase [Syntrophomonadaceae bacterium]|nr:16S rRNA (uracil(1498)-N(3))-methyltransferase [Syntrophomonadaceae bacterium]
MRLGKDRDVHRFYVDPGQLREDRVVIAGEEFRHLQKVLRLGVGDQALLIDGSGHEYEVRLLALDLKAQRAEAEIIAIKAVNREPPIVVTLVQGIVRGDRMDFIIQKAAEIGVRRIVPLAAEHGVVRVTGEKARRRVERWRKIAREACKQCGRVVVPEVTEVVDLGQALQMQGDALGIFFYEGEKNRPLKPVLRDNGTLFKQKGVFIHIGPEGGFSMSEVETARRCGLFLAGLGPRILRAETAALAALTTVLYELGDLGGEEQ